jgi:hypothetical protein
LGACPHGGVLLDWTLPTGSGAMQGRSACWSGGHSDCPVVYGAPGVWWAVWTDGIPEPPRLGCRWRGQIGPFGGWQDPLGCTTFSVSLASCCFPLLTCVS